MNTRFLQAVRPHVTQGSVSAAATAIIGLAAMAFPAVADHQDAATAALTAAFGILNAVLGAWQLVDEIRYTRRRIRSVGVMVDFAGAMVEAGRKMCLEQHSQEKVKTTLSED